MPCLRCTGTPASPVSPHQMHVSSYFVSPATLSTVNVSFLNKVKKTTGHDCLSETMARCLFIPCYGRQNRPGLEKLLTADSRTPPPLQCRQKPSQDQRAKLPL